MTCFNLNPHVIVFGLFDFYFRSSRTLNSKRFQPSLKVSIIFPLDLVIYGQLVSWIRSKIRRVHHSTSFIGFFMSKVTITVRQTKYLVRKSQTVNHVKFISILSKIHQSYERLSSVLDEHFFEGDTKFFVVVDCWEPEYFLRKKNHNLFRILQE